MTAIKFIASLLIGSFTFGIGYAIVGIVFSFKYNKIYIRDLIKKGWVQLDDESNSMLRLKGYDNT